LTRTSPATTTSMTTTKLAGRLLKEREREREREKERDCLDWVVVGSLPRAAFFVVVCFRLDSS